MFPEKARNKKKKFKNSVIYHHDMEEKVNIAVRIMNNFADDNVSKSINSRVIAHIEAKSLEHTGMAWEEFLQTYSDWSRGLSLLHHVKLGLKNYPISDSLKAEMIQDIENISE